MKQSPSHLQQELYQGIVAIQPKKSRNSHRVQDFKCCICETKLLIQWTGTGSTEKPWATAALYWCQARKYSSSLSPHQEGLSEMSTNDDYTYTHTVISKSHSYKITINHNDLFIEKNDEQDNT